MAINTCNDVPSKLHVSITLDSEDCPSPFAEFAMASTNQSTWTTVPDQGTNPLPATLTCAASSTGPALLLAISDPAGCVPATVSLTVDSFDPFSASSSVPSISH